MVVMELMELMGNDKAGEKGKRNRQRINIKLSMLVDAHYSGHLTLTRTTRQDQNIINTVEMLCRKRE